MTAAFDEGFGDELPTGGPLAVFLKRSSTGSARPDRQATTPSAATRSTASATLKPRALCGRRCRGGERRGGARTVLMTPGDKPNEGTRRAWSGPMVRNAAWLLKRGWQTGETPLEEV